MATSVALLRAINLGSRNRVPMPALRDRLTELGYDAVRTVAQSGNIVLDTAQPPAELAAALRREITDAFDVDTPVIVRSGEEMLAVAERVPFPEALALPKQLQVFFLSGPCPPAAAELIEAADVAPELVNARAGEREIFAFHAAGVRHSRLTSLLTDARLGVTVTARNWNTVTKLAELVRPAATGGHGPG